MQMLPPLSPRGVPPFRKTSSAEQLHQFILEDAEFYQKEIPVWVRETARRGDDEITRAGNPKFKATSINGTSGDTGKQRSGFVSGEIAQAKTAVRILYQANELAHVANMLRPVLSRIIHARFPNSRLRRLERDWIWFLMRDGRLINLGGSVAVALEVTDRLYLVPDAPEPARYAWLANWRSKRMDSIWLQDARRLRRMKKNRKNKAANPRNRREGFLGSAAGAMRRMRIPGVIIHAVMIGYGMTAPFSKTPRRGVPSIQLRFAPLRTAVQT